MRGKKLISILYHLLKVVLYINIVLAGGILGFQLLNFLHPDKSLITTYLGKFAMELNSTGSFQSLNHKGVAVYIENITGLPSLGMNSHWHSIYVLIFTLAVGGVTLFYNFKFYKIFELLRNSIQEGTPFTLEISKELKSVALFSIIVFVAGSLLSVLKLIILKDITFQNFVAHPVFDNQLLNFLWFGLAIYILNEIYKVGIELKNEQDLTI